MVGIFKLGENACCEESAVNARFLGSRDPVAEKPFHAVTGNRGDTRRGRARH
jgi:hypothetical protein